MSTLKRSDFFYELPEELIAQTPVEPRDSSRLMVYSRSDGTVTHAHFRDLPNFLKKKMNFLQQLLKELIMAQFMYKSQILILKVLCFQMIKFLAKNLM